jgi:ATP diphosphatase
MNQSKKAASSILQNVDDDNSLTLLNTSYVIQEKCAKVGFDWPNAAPVFDKVAEELDEVKEALDNPEKCQQHVQDELGDLLFACINLCRHLQVKPEDALAQANQKFINRFKQVESMLNDENSTLDAKNLSELEEYWQRAKKRLTDA